MRALVSWSIYCLLTAFAIIKVLVKKTILQIGDGGSQSIGGTGFQRLHRNALAFPRLRPPAVRQLDPLHGGHLLPDLANPYSHCQANRGGWFIGINKPWSRACLLLNNWHCHLCFCSPHCSYKGTTCTDSTSNLIERDINHDSCCDPNTRPLGAVSHHCD